MTLEKEKLSSNMSEFNVLQFSIITSMRETLDGSYRDNEALPTFHMNSILYVSRHHVVLIPMLRKKTTAGVNPESSVHYNTFYTGDIYLCVFIAG